MLEVGAASTTSIITVKAPETLTLCEKCMPRHLQGLVNCGAIMPLWSTIAKQYTAPIMHCWKTYCSHCSDDCMSMTNIEGILRSQCCRTPGRVPSGSF